MSHRLSSLPTLGGVALVLGLAACSHQHQTREPELAWSGGPQQATPTAGEERTGVTNAQPGTPAYGVIATQKPAEGTAEPQANRAISTEPALPPAVARSPGQSQAAPAPAASIDDAQIAATIVALDQTEIQAGQIAMAKARVPGVRLFAVHLLNMHEAVLNGSLVAFAHANIHPNDGAVSKQVRGEGDALLSTLGSLRGGRDFDREFIDGQIAAHNHALQLIDDMLTAVKNPTVKTELERTRQRVHSDLRRAEGVQRGLQAAY
jgi:putative membrane protein